jgi:hypothetical protein
MNFFDAHTWIGRWPFAFLPEFGPRALAAHLRRHGIRRALVSPLDAVFQPEPGPANRALLRGTRGVPGLVPVPVINPMLANWREELAVCAADARVRAVRLLPSYHATRLRAKPVQALSSELARRGLRLALTIRLIDERHEYFALRIKGVPAAELAVFLQRHPELPVLANGLGRAEIRDLTPKHPQLLADVSFAEWHRSLEHLLEAAPARQLAFASHTPFLVTAAARAKLDRPELRAPDLAGIAGGNLERWLDA